MHVCQNATFSAARDLPAKGQHPVVAVSGALFPLCDFTLQILLITPAQTPEPHTLEFRTAHEDTRYFIFIVQRFSCKYNM